MIRFVLLKHKRGLWTVALFDGQHVVSMGAGLPKKKAESYRAKLRQLWREIPSGRRVVLMESIANDLYKAQSGQW